MPRVSGSELAIRTSGMPCTWWVQRAMLASLSTWAAVHGSVSILSTPPWVSMLIMLELPSSCAGALYWVSTYCSQLCIA